MGEIIISPIILFYHNVNNNIIVHLQSMRLLLNKVFNKGRCKMKNKKYKFTDDIIVFNNNRTLYRIEALIDIPEIRVNAGDIGGYIESEENLSHYGTCWVADDARVFDNAKVLDNAQVFNNAIVWGNAKVYGNAQVYDNALIHDKSTIFGNAQIYNNAWVLNDAQIYDNARVYENAIISGNSIICDNTHVNEHTSVYNNFYSN